MKNTKRSITLKVLTGYIMIGLLVVVAIYFIYPQIKTFPASTFNHLITANDFGNCPDMQTTR